jgi:hypothetical protein
LLSTGLLAGCTGGGGTSAAPTSRSPAQGGGATEGSTTTPAGSDGTAAPADDEGSTDASPFPADTRPDKQAPAAGTRATVTDIRIGRHNGFDRVVFKVGGTGTPGWDVRYVDEASSQGSGAPVQVDGAAILQVTLTGMGLPHDTGVDEWSGPDPLASRDTKVVTELVWDATFEGTSVAFVGTTAEVPFRVYALAGPARVVLEVANRS